METTAEKTTATSPGPPEYNPDYVRITSKLECDNHLWTIGEIYETSKMHKKIEGARDANGLDIYVVSVRWNRPIWLSSKDYELVNPIK